MLAVMHLRLRDPEGAVADSSALLTALGARTGFIRGSLGQALDDRGEWVLVSEWADVGSYRRGLSAYEVKVAFAPLTAYVRDDVSAYEIVEAR